MLKNRTRKDYAAFLLMTGVLMFVTGMGLSKVLMSMGTFIGLFALLLEGNFKSYFANIKTNKIYHWILILFSLHLIGLLWTTNFEFAFHDIRMKLSILLIPLLIIAKPFEKRQIHLILAVFILSIAVSSWINFAAYQHWVGDKVYTDIREMSLFGSHIRYSILVVLACVFLYEYYSQIQRAQIKIVILLLVTWFLFYTFYSQVLTGYLSLIIVVCIIAVKRFYKARMIIIGFLVSIFILAGGMLFSFLKPVPLKVIDFSSLPKVTAEGNLYKNDSTLIGMSSSEPLFLSICDIEMEREWNKRSTIHFYGRDALNQRIRTTLIRYLTSKNLTKDGIGVKKLTVDDIKAIESGKADVNETRIGIVARLYGLKYQLQNSSDPNGHSLLQRLEYWKAAQRIISKNYWMGVGTGDVQIAFNHEYNQMSSPLKAENRLRAHNTYLTMWITFGMAGIICFLIFLFVFTRYQIQNKNVIGLCFALIMIISFAIEDTLETQLGASLFAFFTAWFSVNGLLNKKNLTDHQ